MEDVLHQFTINAPASKIFQAVSTPAGIDAWWTVRSAGNAAEGAMYELWFGPEYDWRAVVSRCIPNREFELEMKTAMDDWIGTRVGFLLDEKDGVTKVVFYHSGWAEPSEHFRISSFCWATYLRLLKRYVERGEVVPYEARDDA